jgi:hypothetical protein
VGELRKENIKLHRHVHVERHAVACYFSTEYDAMRWTRNTDFFSRHVISVDCRKFPNFGLIQHRDMNSPLAESGLCLTTNSTMAHRKRQKKISSLLRGAKYCKCEVPTGCRCTALGGFFCFT